MRTGIQLHKGLFNETLPRFLATEDLSAPLAWVSVDCDLYAGARDVLALLGPHIRAGTRLHFHEIIYGHKWLTAFNKNHTPPDYPLSDEARALYEWLRAHPKALLELRPVKSMTNTQAAAFVARQIAGPVRSAAGP